MKYTKAESPFALKDGKKSHVRIWSQPAKRMLENLVTVKVLMAPTTVSDKMVLTSDVKPFLPWPSRGAVLPRTHSFNVAPVIEAGVIELHPEVYDEYLEKGIIDKDGNCLTVKDEPKGPGTPPPTPERPADTDKDPATAPEAEAFDALDVNKDGKVDAKDVAEVANAAAAKESEAEEGEEPTLEEIQKSIQAMDKKQLKGWTSCMQDKIVDHYGPEVKACTDGINHGNWEEILECMVTALGIADPEVWIPEQIVLFTGWSVECIF